MLRWRILTAIVLIPIVFFGLFYLSPLLFKCATAFVFFLGALEWANLCHLDSWIKKMIFFNLFILCMLGMSFVTPSLLVLGVGCVFWAFMVFLVIAHPRCASFLSPSPWRAVIGVLCLSTSWYALISLRSFSFGPQWLLLLLLIIWSTDTIAYFVGKQWGHRPLAPLISPKKTVAGFLGGVAGALLVSILLYFLYQVPVLQSKSPWLFQNKHFLLWCSLAYLTILLAVAGDLFESLVKRISGVKDSGSLLPGHGGILDRVDSLIAALPFYALAVAWLQGI